MSKPDEIQHQLSAEVAHANAPASPAVDALVVLQGIATTRSDIEALRKLRLPPAQIMADPEGGQTDFLARASGGARQKAFVYRAGRLVETDMDGRDVTETFDLMLRQLIPEEEVRFQTMRAELEENRHRLEAIVNIEGKEPEIEAIRERISQLERDIETIKPVLIRERERFEDGIMNIPVGTVLFMSVQNASDLYPVMVVEDDDGLKWVETMAEITPNGLVRGGVHSRGFRIPLRNNIGNGALYLPTGMRKDRNLIDSSNGGPNLLPPYFPTI